jgi:putative methyltransferase (TIGR04325 family)
MSRRDVTNDWVPPALYRGYRRARRRLAGLPPAWEYAGDTWPAGDDELADDAGWESPTVVEHYRAKLAPFRAAVAGTGSIGVPTEALAGVVPRQYEQNVVLSYAYAVARASAHREQITVLDWGGGYGYLSFVIAALFPGLRVDFHVKEMPNIARAARVDVPEVTFWDDEACLDRSFDLISACGSLQYQHDLNETMRRFGASARYVFLSRTPVCEHAPSFLVRQHAYGTSYVGWTFNRAELVRAAEAAQLELEREFIEGFSPNVIGAPERDEHRGFLFQRRMHA